MHNNTNTTSGLSLEGETNRNLPTPATGVPRRSRKRLGVKVGHVFIPIWKSTCRGRDLYQVAKPRVPGSRRRQLATFTTLAEAEAYARSLATGQVNDHKIFAQISAAELKTAAVIAGLLQPFADKFGITIEQAVKEYCAAKEVADKRWLPDLVKDYLLQPWVTLSRMPFPEAVEKFLEAKRNKGCRRETLRNLKYNLEPFGRGIGNPPIGDITTAHLNARIHRPGYSKRGNKTIYCGLHNLFAWLKRHGYLRPDQPTAMDKVETPIVDKHPPVIVPVETARQMLRLLVQAGDVEGALAIALGFFSGIRMDEMQGLRMEKHLDAGQRINVTADIAKTHVPRTMPILPVLDAWLRPFYTRPGFLFHRQDPQRRAATILKPHGIPWTKNWLRHSYCSYRLAHTGEVQETADEAGHSVGIMARNYLNRVVKDKTKVYFSFTPEACGITDWPERVAAFIAKTGECLERKKCPRLPRSTKIPAPAPETIVTALN